MNKKKYERSDPNTPDRVLVRDRIQQVGRPLVVKTLVDSGWGVSSVDSAKTKLANYLSGERTINATDYVILVNVVFQVQMTLDALGKALSAPA